MQDRPHNFQFDHSRTRNMTDYRGVQQAPEDKRTQGLWEQWRLDQQAAADYLDKIGRRGSVSRTWVEREQTKELIQNQSI